MKRILDAIAFTAVLLMTNRALAADFNLKCLDATGETDDCRVTIAANQLQVTYESSRNRSLNVTVPGDRILGVVQGDRLQDDGQDTAVAMSIASTVSSYIPVPLPIPVPIGLVGSLFRSKPRTFVGDSI
ncbi:hypothetical protein [Trichothermofontia sp.]